MIDFDFVYDILINKIDRSVLWLTIAVLVIATIQLGKIVNFWRTRQSGQWQRLSYQELYRECGRIYTRLFLVSMLLVFVTSFLVSWLIQVLLHLTAELSGVRIMRGAN